MNNLSKKILSIAGAFVLALSMTMSVQAADTIEITNITQLRAAIESQAGGLADGQTWNIHGGVDYPLDRSSMIVASGQTGWYFPITANNLTIQGIDNPVIYGNAYALNGAWATQQLVAVFGNNVKLKGVTIMPKVIINKTIEVIGTDFTIENVVIAPNSKIGDEFYTNAGVTINTVDRTFNEEWSGSLFFNHAGNHTVKDVTVNNGVIVTRWSPENTKVTFDNVKVNIQSADPYINSAWNNPVFNSPTGSSLVGSPKVTYIVDETTNNLAAALSGAHAGDTIKFNSNITSVTPVVINKAVKIDGNGKVFTGNLSVSVLNAAVTNLTVIDPTVSTTGAINLSTLIPSGTGELPKMTVTSALNTIVLDIQAGTIVTAPGWDGFLHLPTRVDNSTVTAPAGPDETSTVEFAFTVGSNVPMSFNKGVRILFPGEKGKRVGYAQNGGMLTEITDVCSADTQAVGDTLPTNGNCVITTGPDLVVWTKHFTTFATFTTSTTTPSVTSRVIGGGGGGSRAVATVTAPTTTVTTPPAPVGQVLGEQTYVFTINQKFGTRGHIDVKELQKLLNKQGFAAGTEDSIFGSKTQSALKSYQKTKGLTADGIVGPLTRSVLNK